MSPETPPPAPLSTVPSAPKPKKKSCLRRGCLGCLYVAAVPLAALAGFLIWLSLGSAPAPADCLPPDAPARITVRQPVELLGAVLADSRRRAIIEKLAAPPARSPGGGLQELDQLDRRAWLARRLTGDELAVAPGGGGEGGGALIAMRPTLAARALERLFRLGAKEPVAGVRAGPGGAFGYGFIGKTLVAGRSPADVAAALARREAILARKPGESWPPEDARVAAELDFAVEPGWAAALLDLPAPARFTARVQAGNDLHITGRAEVRPERGSDALPYPLPIEGPASARLVAPDAILYWVWQAPASRGRWGAEGRLQAAKSMPGAASRDWQAIFEALEKSGADAILSRAAAGERAAFVAGQPGPAGEPLLPAAGVLFECRNARSAWGAARKALSETCGWPFSADGRPPVSVGKAVYPYLAPRSHAGVEYLELVYEVYPLGSGYRPAFGAVGDWLVATTSRAELERIIDRAAAAGTGRSPGMLLPQRADGRRPAASLLLAPEGRAKELAGLLLAAAHNFSEPGKEPGQDDQRRIEALAEALAEVRSLRLDWFAGEKPGELGLELDARIRE